jgi:hypothetical protein
MAKKNTPAVSTAKTATLTLGGKTYKLGYDFNKIADTEREAGCNLLHGLADIANISAPQLRGLFLAAIRAADPKSTMTIQQAGSLIRFETIIPVSEALAESILLSVPAETAAA